MDPGQGLSGKMDIAISDGKIAAIQPDIPVEEARRVIQIKGDNRYITPVRIRGRVGWYTSGGLLWLPLGRVWVHIHGDRAVAERYARFLRDAARAGPHPRLDQPLPAPAPGLVEDDCPQPPPVR